jgi:hypothetical protein
VSIPVPGVSTPPPGLNSGVIPPLVPQAQGTPKKASPLPLLVCITLLLMSALILVFQNQLGGGVWYVVGYVLTPVLTALTLGWDSVLQRNGRKDPWFAPSPLFSRIIRIAVALSFVLAVFHILEIAHICGQSVIQSGALCV